jgi:hypothetical protein
MKITAFKMGGLADITVDDRHARLWFPDGGAMGDHNTGTVKNLVAKYNAGVVDADGLIEQLRSAGFEVGTGRKAESPFEGLECSRGCGRIMQPGLGPDATCGLCE